MLFNRKLSDKDLHSLWQMLDISTELFEKAVKRYEDIGLWLNRYDSEIKKYSPAIYPQGSFRLGTVIKPISNQDDYDIDIVCKLELSKTDFSQNDLKEIVGNEIKKIAKNEDIKPPKNGRRCWTIEFDDGVNFHIDILPAVSDKSDFKLLLEKKGYESIYADDAIAITDKEDDNYNSISSKWHVSNPIGYSNWFKKQMEKQQILLEKAASLENVPIYTKKTTLQRVIQLLKRHRDINFGEDEDKPISIIITTLAAKAYNNSDNFWNALKHILANMEHHLIKDNLGHYEALNPVNPLENFADKWLESPTKKDNFLLWLSNVKDDLGRFAKNQDFIMIKEALQFPNQTGITQLIESSIMKEAFTNESLSHYQCLKYKKNISGAVWIKGYYERNIGGSMKRSFPSNGDSLPKECELEFVANTNIKKPFKIIWQVVNTGAEARRKSALRGGFEIGEKKRGKKYRIEKTRYTGKHWIECYVIKNNICVAQSKKYFVNII